MTCAMITNHNDLLFKHVRCNIAIYELHDGIGFYRDSEGKWLYNDMRKSNQIIDWNLKTTIRIPKKYISIKKINFSGFVVGIKSIRCSADLVIAKQNDNKFLDVKIWRENEEFRQVAIVYYANNRKRLVPIEYCEFK